jgi:site-specific recombinase XerD
MKSPFKPTDFAYELYRFFTVYLPSDRNYSQHTIDSYNTTFNLLRTYCEEVKGFQMESFQIADLTESLVDSFLQWVVESRGNSVATKNQRLTALHSFFRFLSRRNSKYVMQAQMIYAIKPAKYRQTAIPYLQFNEIQAILQQPNSKERNGHRNKVLLELLYETAVRVQEIADIKLKDIRFEHPATLRIANGKGGKQRIVPIAAKVAERLRKYAEVNGLLSDSCSDHYFFTNRDGGKLTRAGITYILKKYADHAKTKGLLASQAKISPHVMRHSKAVHLLQAGVNLVYIRDILGHEDISTTEIYAKVDPQAKRAAIEAAFSDTQLGDKDEESPWQKDDALLSWLMKLGADNFIPEMES